MTDTTASAGPTAVPLAVRAGRQLGYHVTGLFLAVPAFVLATAGLSVGAGTLVVWIGIPVLAATLAVSRWFAELERRSTEQVLGRSLPPHHYRELSGGQRQRLSILLALVGNPRVTILDELTTGLDPQARRDTWSAIEQIRETGVTVLLVTHFMEEAERLCDRVAVIDAGRVVALDTPAKLVAGLADGQRLRFRPSAPFPDALLTGLPQVSALVRRGDHVEVRGGGDLLTAVTSALAGHGVIPEQLRMEQASLDDVFVALTGHRASSPAAFDQNRDERRK